MPLPTSRELFVASCADSSSYPKNLLQTHKFEYTLNAYSYRLSDEKDNLFRNDKQSIFIWDLVDNAEAFNLSPNIESLQQLKENVNENTLDPQCRFVFLRTFNHRERMCCTFSQLTYLFSYHQVMPSFLDFCFELRSREDPLSTTLFRQEDYIGQRYVGTSLEHLGRSGTRLQHAFNILGFDEKSSHDYNWPLRYITVYHSFDIKLGRSFWIIIKGDGAMKERITTSTRKSQKEDPCAMKTPTGAFVASLRAHLLILEWCTHHWNDYIDYLDFRSKEPSAAVTLSPVSEIAKEFPDNWAQLRRASSIATGRSRRATGLSQHTGNGESSIMPKLLTRLSDGLSRMAPGLSAQARPPMQQSLPGAGSSQTPAQPENERHVQLEDIFTFNKLQTLHKLSSEVDKANMIIEQNKRILVLMREKYKALSESDDFKSLFDFKSCEADFIDFLHQIRNLESDLENHQTRLRTLLRKLEKDEALFTGVLQYQSMQTGEFFAKSADTSAARMEEWTIKMHDIAARTEQETVAMSVITFFTLVFLPGTFVAVRYGIPITGTVATSILTRSQTFFSSNIVKFDNSKSGNFGDWELQMSALKLFLTMSLPLMFITLFVWAVLRTYAGRKRRVKLALAELPLIEKPKGTTFGTLTVFR
ncbi:hypothetical protein QQS21_000575 [Conoideocrella luteorostrata]|uniref:CorA-like transporter domain-containing protein n=1 Tax=Conoideocrella luteorostrata TaxID=1105319 RepID=A0AAJ0CYS8_9HYPO|nr:hypothetical protein QQS21_000575 [Conoideocrella luteorostrata]